MVESVATYGAEVWEITERLKNRLFELNSIAGVCVSFGYISDLFCSYVLIIALVPMPLYKLFQQLLN